MNMESAWRGDIIILLFRTYYMTYGCAICTFSFKFFVDFYFLLWFFSGSAGLYKQGKTFLSHHKIHVCVWKNMKIWVHLPLKGMIQTFELNKYIIKLNFIFFWFVVIFMVAGGRGCEKWWKCYTNENYFRSLFFFPLDGSAAAMISTYRIPHPRALVLACMTWHKIRIYMYATQNKCAICFYYDFPTFVEYMKMLRW